VNEYNTPIILTCNLTGRKQKLYHRPYIDALITKHGSLENLLKNYIAKGVKRKDEIAVKQTTPVEVVKAAAKVKHSDTNLKPSSVRVIGKTTDGDDQTCTVYDNYDS